MSVTALIQWSIFMTCFTYMHAPVAHCANFSVVWQSMHSSERPLVLLLFCRQIKGGESSTYLMMPIVSTLDRGEFTVKLKAFSSQREDYEEIPIKIDVSHWVSFQYFDVGCKQEPVWVNRSIIQSANPVFKSGSKAHETWHDKTQNTLKDKEIHTEEKAIKTDDYKAEWQNTQTSGEWSVNSATK